MYTMKYDPIYPSHFSFPSPLKFPYPTCLALKFMFSLLFIIFIVRPTKSSQHCPSVHKCVIFSFLLLLYLIFLVPKRLTKCQNIRLFKNLSLQLGMNQEAMLENDTQVKHCVGDVCLRINNSSIGVQFCHFHIPSFIVYNIHNHWCIN